MKLDIFRGLTIVTLLAYGVHGHAANLNTVYHDALLGDPTFKKAEADMLSSKAVAPQALAALLTQISGTATGDVGRTITNNVTALTTTSPNSNYTSRTTNYGIDIDQPIFDFTKLMKYFAAKATAKAAGVTFAQATQDLIRRTTNGYFNVLQKAELLKFAEAHKVSLKRQLDQAQARYKVGLNTIKDVYEAKAKYYMADAQKISDQNELADSKEQLRQITGKTYKHLWSVKPGFVLKPPTPAKIDQWTQWSETQNLTLKADQLKTLAAQRTIKQNFGGHLPTLDLNAGYDRTKQRYNNNGETGDTSASTVGLSLNLPIFEGGGVTADVHQAEAVYQSTAEQQNIDHRAVIAATRQDYLGVQSKVSQVQADKRAITASRSALKTAEAEFKVGTATMLDVLTQQSNLFRSQSDYSQDFLGYIQSLIALQEDVGQLSPDVVARLNGWLVSPSK